MILVEGGGFVYGAMSFVDKVSCGIALMLIQNQMPDPATDDPQFFESVIVYWCGGAAIFGVLIMAILWPMKLGQRYLYLILIIYSVSYFCIP